MAGLGPSLAPQPLCLMLGSRCFFHRITGVFPFPTPAGLGSCPQGLLAEITVDLGRCHRARAPRLTLKVLTVSPVPRIQYWAASPLTRAWSPVGNGGLHL